MEVSGQLHARPLYARERMPGTPLLGDWVGPRAVLDGVVKNLQTLPRLKTNHLARSLVL